MQDGHTSNLDSAAVDLKGNLPADFGRFNHMSQRMTANKMTWRPGECQVNIDSRRLISLAAHSMGC